METPLARRGRSERLGRSVGTHLFGSSNFIRSQYYAPQLFLGLGSLFLLFFYCFLSQCSLAFRYVCGGPGAIAIVWIELSPIQTIGDLPQNSLHSLSDAVIFVDDHAVPKTSGVIVR